MLNILLPTTSNRPRFYACIRTLVMPKRRAGMVWILERPSLEKILTVIYLASVKFSVICFAVNRWTQLSTSK